MADRVVALMFTSMILIFVFLFIIHQCCEFFGCADLCKRGQNRNVVEVQQLPVVAADIQRDIPEITVVAFEVK